MSSFHDAKRGGLISAVLGRAGRRASRRRMRTSRGARRLGMEALEVRKLLSVSPMMLPAAGFTADLAGPSETLHEDISLIRWSHEMHFRGPCERASAIGSLNAAESASLKAPVAAAMEAPSAAENASPIAHDDTFSIAADQQLGAGVLGNDVDPDGDPLQAVLENAVTNGTLVLTAEGLFTYTPNEGFVGTDSFTYIANDGQTDSEPATATISVMSVNDQPGGANDSYLTKESQPLAVAADSGVLANDFDPNGDPLTAVLVSAPAHGTVKLASDGSFEYTPEANFNGEDSFTYAANDGQTDGKPATVSITVEAVNDAPIAVDDAYSVNEDDTLVVEADGALANDTDVDGDLLASVLVSGPVHGTVTLASDGSFEYAPEGDFHGEDSFTYAANDGLVDGSPATVSITVEPVNDAPVSVDDAYSVNEDDTLVVEADGALANDADVDGDPLSAVLVSGPSYGTVTLAPDGSLEYTPEGGFHGEDSFTYVANDGQTDGNPAT